MAVEDADTTRARIQTYVPEYQKREWERHADEMDMSLSEFVRSMVQAGRSGFEGPESDSLKEKAPATPSSDADPQGADLEQRVLAALGHDEYVDWDGLLLATVTDDVKNRLDETLGELQDAGRVTYSGRHGGYTLE